MRTSERTKRMFGKRHLAFAGLSVDAVDGHGLRQRQCAGCALPCRRRWLPWSRRRRRMFPNILDEIGRNAAFESVTVTPQVAGRITERHFQDGENLKQGQLLFVIDPRPYQAQVDAAQAALAQAKAALDLAKIQFARDQEVIGTKAISKQDYDTKKNAVDVDQAQVESAQASA